MVAAKESLQPELRLDVWLWRARFYKSRAVSTRTIRDGKIRLERFGQTIRASKPNTVIRPGDRLTFMRDKELFHIEVLELGSRRGPSAEALELFTIIQPVKNLFLSA